MENKQTPEEMANEFHESFNYSKCLTSTGINTSVALKAGFIEGYNRATSHHQEANEINVCFSKPYQKLQRELFEKKKESELFKEANAKLVEALRWIPVTERLPEIGNRVLVVEHECSTQIAVYSYEGPYGEKLKSPVFCDEQDEQPSKVYPTHWMPLPELPLQTYETK